MARWSPTVLPFSMDPYGDRDRITGGIQSQIAANQAQDRITEIQRRTDIAAEESRRRGAQWGAQMHDYYGYEGPRGEPPEPHTPDESQAGGTGSAPATAPQASEGIVPQRGGGGPPLGAYNPMHQGPQFGPGDVRNEEVIRERIEVLGGGTIAPIGERPQEQYEAGQRARTGGMLHDMYGGMLGLPEGSEAYMEHTGGMPPIMQPHQQAGYASSEEMADDSYNLNRVSPQVLAALIRANSGEGGGMTANRYNDILTNQFETAVSAYIRSKRDAGQEVSVEEAYLAVGSDPRFSNVNTSLPDFAGLYPNVYGSGGFAAISPGVDPETGEAVADPQVTGLVAEAMMSATPGVTMDRIRIQHGDEVANRVQQQLDIIRRIQYMQRFGGGAYYGID